MPPNVRRKLRYEGGNLQPSAASAAEIAASGAGPEIWQAL